MKSVEKALNVVHMYLDEDEQIVESAYGSLSFHLLEGNGQRKGILLATNKRMLFYSIFLREEICTTFSYEGVHSIEMKKGLFNGPSIIFRYEGNEEVMTRIEEGNVDRFVHVVQERIVV